MPDEDLSEDLEGYPPYMYDDDCWAESVRDYILQT
jgi:hypothetical protein